MMVHIIRIPHDLSTVTSYYLHTPASSLSCFDCAAGNVAGVVVVDVTIVADDADDFNDRRQKYLPASFCNNHYLLPPSLSLSLSLSLSGVYLFLFSQLCFSLSVFIPSISFPLPLSAYSLLFIFIYFSLPFSLIFASALLLSSLSKF